MMENSSYIMKLERIQTRFRVGIAFNSQADIIDTVKCTPFAKHTAMMPSIMMEGSIDHARELHNEYVPEWKVADFRQRIAPGDEGWICKLALDYPTFVDSSKHIPGWSISCPARAYFCAVLEAMIFVEREKTREQLSRNGRIQKLIAQVEAGAVKFDSDKGVSNLMFGHEDALHWIIQAFNGDISYAELLHTTLLPEYGMEVFVRPNNTTRCRIFKDGWSDDYTHWTEDEKYSRAWLKAILPMTIASELEAAK
jgi:hypothetical protein